jgi:hypothetical protein
MGVVERALDELAPPRPAPDQWDEIVASATPARQARFLIAPVALAAAIALVVLAWPFARGSHGTLLERAAAAIGNGPVLHVVAPDQFSATQTDLRTGAKTVIHQQDEYWYDPARGVRAVTSFAGVVQRDVTYPPTRVNDLDKTLAFLAIDYRAALRNGTARLLGPGHVDETPVYWIRVGTRDVAIARSTLRPVATRGRDGITRLESVESLASGSVTISPTPPPTTTGIPEQIEQTGPLTVAGANFTLGTQVLTAGKSLDGLSLNQILKDVSFVHGVQHVGVTLYYATGDGAYLQISETLDPTPGFPMGGVEFNPPDGTVVTVGPSIGFMKSGRVYVALVASSDQLIVDAAEALSKVRP